MKILLTGGAGFIGSHIAELLQSDHELVIIDDLNDYYDPAYKQANLDLLHPAQFYQLDITDYNALKQVFADHQFDTIIHCAARAGVRPSIKEPELYANVNLLGTTHLAELAAQHKVKQFIFGSTSAVYGNAKQIPFSESEVQLEPISPYAASKLGAELMLHTFHSLYDTKTTILRFFTVYGERGRPDMAPYLFTEAVLNQKQFKKFGDGTTSRDYTYVKDIAAGVKAALDKPLDYEIINLGNNQPVSLNDFIATIETITGESAIYEQIEMQPGDVEHTYANIDKAKQLLNWQPTTSLQDGLTHFIEWYKTERA